MHETEWDLRELLLVLRRRIWMIIAMPVAAAVAAWLVSAYLLDPVYSASTTIWVIKEDGPDQISYNDLLLSRNLTKTYAEVARSRAVITAVIDRLGLQGVTVAELQEKITTTPVRDTEIISFQVEDGDPAMAARLANAVAEAFKEQIRTYMKVENVAIVDPAVAPARPIKPRPLLNTAIAFVLGAMAAVGLSFLLEYLDTSVKSPEDVTRHLGVPVVGVIPAFEAEAPVQAQARESGRRVPVRRKLEGEKR
jgi:capsular polysaccharide biosynthesis protein